MPDPCPCGTRQKAATYGLTYWDGEAVKALAGAQYPTFAPLIDQLIGQPTDWSFLCQSIPPDPVTYTLADFLPANWGATLDKINRDAIATNWHLQCECIPCPPISGCSGGGTVALGPANGFCHDMEVIGGVDTCVQKEYIMYGGVDVYVSRDSDGHCYGPFNGLVVDWGINSTFDPSLPVNLASYGGGSATGWNGSLFGQNLTAYVGGGSGGAPVWPWPDAPTDVQPYPNPPACNPATVCTAISYLQDSIERIQRVVDQLLTFAGPSQEATISLPGGPGPITGSVPALFGPTLQALLPITPSQLTNPVATILPASGTVDVTGTAFLKVNLDVVPDYFGYRGTDAQIYYSNARSPGPGWLLLEGAYGVIGYYPLVYPTGLQILIPPTATSAVLDLTPGVQVTLTTYNRSLS